MSSAIGRDLKARNGNFNFDVQVWVKFFSSLLDGIVNLLRAARSCSVTSTPVPTENLVPPLCTLGIIEDLASAC